MTAKEIDRNVKVKNLIVNIVRNGDSRAGAGSTLAASGEGGADCCVGGPVADRIGPSSNRRAGEECVDKKTLVTIRRAGDMAKSKGKSKRNSGQNHMSNVRCWNCGRTGHYGRDCREMWWSRDQGKSKGKGKGKGKGKLNNVESSNWQEGWSEQGAQGDEHADGWTLSGEQVDGWWKTTDWQTGSGSGWWMTAKDQTCWDTEEPIGGFEISSTEGCWSENPGSDGKQRMRRWQRPQEIKQYL